MSLDNIRHCSNAGTKKPKNQTIECNHSNSFATGNTYGCKNKKSGIIMVEMQCVCGVKWRIPQSVSHD